MVTVTVTAKFRNPSLSRRKEWQHAVRLDKEQRRIKDLNHKLSRRLITFAEQFENPGHSDRIS